MKTRKLEKKTAFVFKKNVVKDLTKDQMNKINGGGGNGGEIKPSSIIGCDKTLAVTAQID